MFDQIRDPNVFGEVLRDLIFNTNDKYSYGCYTCFDLRKGFKEISIESELGQWLKKILAESYQWPDIMEPPHQEELDEVVRLGKFYSNGQIHCAWFWDGDGCLVVSYGSRTVVNDDCEKDYGWEWVDNPHH